MTAPQSQPGGGSNFNLSDTDLRKAQEDFNTAAREVEREFTELQAQVLANPSAGRAFEEAKKVAAQLEAEAIKFRNLTRTFAEEIGSSADQYLALNAAGAERIAQAGRGLGEATGATYGRLVPNGPA